MSQETYTKDPVHCGAKMAMDVQDNFMDYIHGFRDRFSSDFAHHIPEHRIAVNAFASLLQQHGYACDEILSEIPLEFEGGEFENYTERRRLVAQNGGRQVIEITISNGDPKQDHTRYITNLAAAA